MKDLTESYHITRFQVTPEVPGMEMLVKFHKDRFAVNQSESHLTYLKLILSHCEYLIGLFDDLCKV